MIQDINNATFTVLHVDKEFLPSASALYTYILTLHKKVAIVCSDEIELKLKFLPWSDKIKVVTPSSADLNIDLKVSATELFELFETKNIKINPKMATALYAGLLLETNNFLNTSLHGTKFAMAKVLVESGADVKACSNFMKQTSLALLRLKAFLLENLCLSENASLASLHIDDKILKASGSGLDECEKIMLEVLELPHVETVQLIKTDNENKIIKKINKENS